MEYSNMTALSLVVCLTTACTLERNGTDALSNGASMGSIPNDARLAGEAWSSHSNDDGGGAQHASDAQAPEDWRSPNANPIARDSEASEDLLGRPDGNIAPDERPSAQQVSLVAVIRDFKRYRFGDSLTNPDFENPYVAFDTKTKACDDRAIVADRLGSDGKPSYKPMSGESPTTHGRAGFDNWYRDVPGINIRVEYPVNFERNANGELEYDSAVSGATISSTNLARGFFPIDDGTPFQTSFGNQGDSHNYSFTMELHAKVTYLGNETIRCRADDDIFVYIDSRLVINLGGLHIAQEATCDVDSIGLEKGRTYNLDIYYAERHKAGADFRVATTLQLKQPIP